LSCIYFIDIWEPLSPVRLVLAVVVPYAMAQWGLRKHSLSNSGARAGNLDGHLVHLLCFMFLANIMMSWLIVLWNCPALVRTVY